MRLAIFLAFGRKARSRVDRGAEYQTGPSFALRAGWASRTSTARWTGGPRSTGRAGGSSRTCGASIANKSLDALRSRRAGDALRSLRPSIPDVPLIAFGASWSSRTRCSGRPSGACGTHQTPELANVNPDVYMPDVQVAVCIDKMCIAILGIARKVTERGHRFPEGDAWPSDALRTL